VTNQVIPQKVNRDEFGQLLEGMDEQDKKALLALAKEYFISKINELVPVKADKKRKK